MSCVVVIRRARAGDEAPRAALLRDSLVEHFRAAFLHFYFQELTLQVCVLCGAVMFIFAGWGPASCAVLPLVMAALVAAAVHLSHLAAAEKLHQEMRAEQCGWVAEAHVPGGVHAQPPPLAAAVCTEEEARRRGLGDDGPVRLQVIGTVSVSAHRASCAEGWVGGAAVAARWRRRGAGRALLRAATQHAAAAGLAGLEAAVSAPQHAARHLLHTQGWQVRAWYSRPLLGSALCLQMARLEYPLPAA